MSGETRRFSLEKDFMNLKTDDLIYGYIQYLATYIPEKKILYVPTAKVSEEIDPISIMIGKSARTAERHIHDLVERKLLKYEIIKLNGVDTPCYVVPQESEGFYQIVKRDMLWYVIQTRSKFCIKIYIYLLNKYQWKKNYHFTGVELEGALGYENKNHNNTAIKIINVCLESLKREGIIDYTEEMVDVKGIKIPNKVLTYVCNDTKELRKV